MQNKKGFTLIELTISILILSIIIIWISLSLIRIWNNLAQSSLEADIFTDIKEFNYDSYLFDYNSWKILSWALVLYNDKNWILIWSFLDKNNWFDFEINTDDSVYNPSYLWYFKIDENTLSWVLNDSDLTTKKFNNWKIFRKVIFKDFFIKPLNSWKIFEIEVEIFKKYSDSYNEKNKSEIFIPIEKYLKFNFNF